MPSFQRFLSLLSPLLLSIVIIGSADAQTKLVVDKTVATVSDGLRTELITLSDVRWQLALQPNTPISPESSDDLNRALQVLINQRIFILEAERLPRNSPTSAEIQAEISRLIGLFPSSAEFERRLRSVGFESVKDDNFERHISQRIVIEKYLDFRFRSFIVNTPEEQSSYYTETFVPDFRRRLPGFVVPSLENAREQINVQLTETKVAANIEGFLDDAKRRVEIVILRSL